MEAITFEMKVMILGRRSGGRKILLIYMKVIMKKRKEIMIRGGSGYQIGWIFGKIPNGLRSPPSCTENYVANFLWQLWLHICEEVWRPDSMKCMHTISRDRDHSEGWGSTAISENSSDMVAWPVPEEKFYKEAFHQFIWISCQVKILKLGRGAWSDAQSVFKLCIFWGVPKRSGIEFYRLL